MKGVGKDEKVGLLFPGVFVFGKFWSLLFNNAKTVKEGLPVMVLMFPFLALIELVKIQSGACAGIVKSPSYLYHFTPG